jgi:archaellum component FlaD/FlaE
MSTTTTTRPYLDGPIGPEQMETALRWARYLGTTFGASGALCSLRYYERIGWIAPAARRSVERQLRGLSIEEIHSKKYDDPGHLDGPLASLSGTPFGAHARSLEFIATIAGDDLEVEVMRAKLAKRRAETATSGSGLPDGDAEVAVD